jgi:hypothetical protein
VPLAANERPSGLKGLARCSVGFNASSRLSALKSPDELDSVFSTLAAQHPDTLQLVADCHSACNIDAAEAKQLIA